MVVIVAGIECDLAAKCTAYKVLNGIFRFPAVIASEAKQSIVRDASWIASSRSLSSGARSRDPLAPCDDGGASIT
jgi:hypothetical protein